MRGRQITLRGCQFCLPIVVSRYDVFLWFFRKFFKKFHFFSTFLFEFSIFFSPSLKLATQKWHAVRVSQVMRFWPPYLNNQILLGYEMRQFSRFFKRFLENLVFKNFFKFEIFNSVVRGRQFTLRGCQFCLPNVVSRCDVFLWFFQKIFKKFHFFFDFLVWIQYFFFTKFEISNPIVACCQGFTGNAILASILE